MFRTALRSVLAHKARLLMTVLAVVLGVAFVSGTLIFTDTSARALTQQFSKSYGNVAVIATSPGALFKDGVKEGEPGISQATIKKIRGLAGVESVAARVSGFAAIGDRDGKLIGNGWSNTGTNFSPGKDGKDPLYTFTEGKGPARAGEVALDQDSAKSGGYKTGDTVRVAVNGPTRNYTLTGIFTSHNAQVNASGSLVLLDTASAQKLYLQPGYYQQVFVDAAADTSPAKLLKRVTPVLGDKNITAQTGAQFAATQAREAEKEMSNLNAMLMAFAAIALFTGVFLIYNTFTMLAAQRTRELALQRAIGASRGQVMKSVMSEALLIGTISSAIGLLTGAGLAIGMNTLMDAAGNTLPVGDLVIAPATALTAMTVGVAVTLVSAALPAWRTGRIAPVAAMSSTHLPDSATSLLARSITGCVISLAGLILIFAGVSTGGSDGRLIIAGGAFLLLTGLLVLLPLLARPLSTALGPLLAKACGPPGKLAAQNAVRNPRRTAATAGPLVIGLALVTSLSVLGITMGRALDRMSTDHLKADYRISMAANNGPLDTSLPQLLDKAPGITAVSPVAGDFVTVKDRPKEISGVDPATIGDLLNLRILSGSLDSLRKGEIAVSDKAAASEGLTVGSTLPVMFGDGQKAGLTVGAIYQEISALLAPLVLDHAILSKHTDSQLTRHIYINTTDGESAAGEKAILDALGRNPAIKIATQQDMRNEIGGMIGTMLNIMYGLLGMALVISVLGVVNTLAMSVRERTQEIGMLRAIGLGRGRVKNMIRLEAMVISLFGAVIGITLGVFLAWAIGTTLAASVPVYELILPYGRITAFLLLAAAVGTLAAMWPARSAARLNVLDAIKE